MTNQEGEMRIPLAKGQDGVVRVRGTGASLDEVVSLFEFGSTAEEIALQLELSLGDVYLVLGYYMSRRFEVERYLETRQGFMNLRWSAA